MKLPTTPPIYLDYHATTPVDPRVAAVVLHALTTAFGNANSTEHIYGEVAAALVTDARREVAELVNADPEGGYFTSGSSESIRLAVAHAVAGRGHRPLRVAVTTVEHRAVLDTVAVHERRGEVTVHWLPVDGQARLDMAALEAACHDGVDLVCVMAANNEVGTVYPVEEVARIAAQAGASTLIDATQAAGQIPIQAAAWGSMYLTVSAHKIYGPKGVGALVAPLGLEVRPPSGSIPGTGDGTPNVPGIVGLGEACRAAAANVMAVEVASRPEVIVAVPPPLARTLMLCNGGVAAGVLSYQRGSGFLQRCPQSAISGSAWSTLPPPGIESRPRRRTAIGSPHRRPLPVGPAWGRSLTPP